MSKIFKVVIALVILIAIFFIAKSLIIKFSNENNINQNIIILEKLREATKVVIWEQDFHLTNISEQEKTYFKYLKTSEKVVTSAYGSLGFHIDLRDTINTKIDILDNEIIVSTPLQLTYLTINNSSINQVKETSLDPTISIDKEQIVKELNEIALRQNLEKSISHVKAESLDKQEASLEALTGKKVKIILTDYPKLEVELKKINKKK